MSINLEDVVTCYNCGKSINPYDSYEVDDMYFCDDCCHACEYCEDVFVDNISKIDGLWVCADCSERMA